MMPRYHVRFLPGAAKVRALVGLTPPITTAFLSGPSVTNIALAQVGANHSTIFDNLQEHAQVVVEFFRRHAGARRTIAITFASVGALAAHEPLRRFFAAVFVSA
jgi:hypothetical protein